jgi:hypothetical protein
MHELVHYIVISVWALGSGIYFVRGVRKVAQHNLEITPITMLELSSAQYNRRRTH